MDGVREREGEYSSSFMPMRFGFGAWTGLRVRGKCWGGDSRRGGGSYILNLRVLAAARMPLFAGFNGKIKETAESE